MTGQEIDADSLGESAFDFRPWCNRALLVVVLTALVSTRLLAHAEAGGLWRDEAQSVEIATHSDFWQNCSKDSFPILWAVVLRGWVALFGSEDASVRGLGLTIGLAIIPAMFWTARQFRVAIPYWMLLFLGLDPSLIIYGGEVRGYGLGVLTLLLMVGAAWRTLQSQTSWRWAGLCLTSLLAVQASYTNCFLLLGTISGCCVVALRRRQYRVLWKFVAVGAVAALSMVPYTVFVFPRVSEWAITIRRPNSWGDLAGVCFETVLQGGVLRMLAWLAVGSLAAVEIARQLRWRNLTNREINAGDEVEHALFLATFFVVGSAGFWWYMKWLHVLTQAWDYLPWLTLLAITADLGSKPWEEREPARYQKKLVAVTVCLLMLFTVVPAVRFRMTSIDLMAQKLVNEAKPDDLIVICPWSMGISFQRYYHGSTPWTNFPNVNHTVGAGYLEMKQQVMSKGTPAGITQDLARFRKVLQSGGRIWWVGQFRSVKPKHVPTVLEPAPDSKHGWDEGAYLDSCLEFASQAIRSVATPVRRIDTDLPVGANPFESPSIRVFQIPAKSRRTPRGVDPPPTDDSNG